MRRGEETRWLTRWLREEEMNLVVRPMGVEVLNGFTVDRPPFFFLLLVEVFYVHKVHILLSVLYCHSRRDREE